MKRVDKRLPMRRGSEKRDAGALAVEGLSFLAADGERLGDFLATTGLAVDNVRQAAASPEFLAGVLSYLASDETVLVAFASHIGADPEQVGRMIAGAIGDPHSE